MYLNNIVVETDDADQETLAEIIEGIEFLVSTPTGKYPMNRDFGIDQNLMDKPLSTIKSLLAIELKDKIETYETRVEVLDVEFDYDDETKALTPIISLELVSYEEDDEEEYDDNLDDDEDDV